MVSEANSQYSGLDSDLDAVFWEFIWWLVRSLEEFEKEERAMYFYVTPRKSWEEYPEGLRIPAEEIIQDCVNFLLVALYRPDEENRYVVDDERLDRLVGDPGAVNWADLRCTHVEKRGNVYVSHVEEASPDADGLKRYLEEWLQRWGWSVVVQTEW